MTLIQAQQKFIKRVNSCKAGHRKRVWTSATKELATWAREHGYDWQLVVNDAGDIANLEFNSDE